MKPCAKLNDGTGCPRGITIHNTGDISVAAGTNAAEQYSRATYNGNMAGVVVHFYVWKDIIWQLLSLNERGWHAADGSTRRQSYRQGQKIGGNLDTIAIEAIGSRADTEETTARLTAWLCKQFRLEPMLDVYQHNYFYPAKACPIYIRPHWAQFLGAADQHFDDEPLTAPEAASPAIKKGDRVRVKETSVPYFPGEKNIPDWLKQYAMTVDGLEHRGGVPCARLAEITSWCAIDNLE